MSSESALIKPLEELSLPNISIRNSLLAEASIPSSCNFLSIFFLTWMVHKRWSDSLNSSENADDKAVSPSVPNAFRCLNSGHNLERALVK